jgi:hypothetical protein
MARWRSIAEEKLIHDFRSNSIESDHSGRSKLVVNQALSGFGFRLSRLEGCPAVTAQSGCRANLRGLVRPISPLLFLLLSHSSPGCKTRRYEFH